jgi:alanine dehydrogenase
MASRAGVRVGVPTEVKDHEERVVLTPSAVATLVARGHRVLVQQGAGAGAGFEDDAYRTAGAELVADAAEVWAADLVVKVKEPQASEYAHFRDDLTLFAYLHLAAEPELSAALVRSGVHAYAFETLTEGRSLPLLAPMSEIAGRAAAIVGAAQLSAASGGSGTLLGGAAGVPPARVVVIGLGVAGTMAARGARGLDAHVAGVDVDLQRLFDLRMTGMLDATQVSEPHAVGELVAEADLVIGAALVPGARAPQVVSSAQVAAMRAGSVIVDLAIDQGGCIETARPTTLSSPTYVEHGVVHYCVTNVPGQFPRTASAALSAAVAPRLLALADDVAAGHAGGPAESARLAGAVNVAGGRLVHPAVADAFPDLPADSGP